MATMQALLEKDKERFLHNMDGAKSSAESVRTVEVFWTVTESRPSGQNPNTVQVSASPRDQAGSCSSFCWDSFFCWQLEQD